MAVDPTQIELTPAQRRRLALLAEQTGREWAVLVDELLDAAPVALGAHTTAVCQPDVHGAGEKSLSDVLADRGILGCFDGPVDLSTNPEYREGFGELSLGASPQKSPLPSPLYSGEREGLGGIFARDWRHAGRRSRPAPDHLTQPARCHSPDDS